MTDTQSYTESSDQDAPIISKHHHRAHKRYPLFLQVLTELVGSFIICFAIYAISVLGATIYSTNLTFVAIAVGLSYAIVTLLFGKISGGHFNPALSVASILTNRIRWYAGLLYIVAQVIGSIIAGALLRVILPHSDKIPLGAWITFAVNGFDKGSVSYTKLALSQLDDINFGIVFAFVVEFIAALVIVGVALRLKRKKQGSDRYALTLGLAYAFGTALAYPVTGAGLNPARSTGIAIFASSLDLREAPLPQLWVFWVAPLLAAVIVSAITLISRLLTTTPQPAPVAIPVNDQTDPTYTEEESPVFDNAGNATAADSSGIPSIENTASSFEEAHTAYNDESATSVNSDSYAQTSQDNNLADPSRQDNI